MKAWVIGGMAAGALILSSAKGIAQTKAPSSYFPKNYPAPGARNGQGANAAPGANNGQAGGAKPAAKAQAPKFKELPVNSQFYFLSDTNHSFAWMKISTTMASNTVNGAKAPINGETAIQR